MYKADKQHTEIQKIVNKPVKKAAIIQKTNNDSESDDYSPNLTCTSLISFALFWILALNLELKLVSRILLFFESFNSFIYFILMRQDFFLWLIQI